MVFTLLFLRIFIDTHFFFKLKKSKTSHLSKITQYTNCIFYCLAIVDLILVHEDKCHYFTLGLKNKIIFTINKWTLKKSHLLKSINRSSHG